MQIFGHRTRQVAGIILSLLPLKATAQTCDAKCGVFMVAGERLDWSAKTFSTTITAATVVEVVNTDDDTTRYSTIYNRIPQGYTIPTNTNAQGTQTVQVAFKRNGQKYTTEIAFPTQFNIFPEYYTWSGTLGTTNANGQAICSTATEALVEVDYWSQPSSFTTPTHSYGPDPGGLLFTTYGHVLNVQGLLMTASPNEAALKSCSLNIAAPENAELTARFITATSTSYESGATSKNSATTTAPTTANNAISSQSSATASTNSANTFRSGISSQLDSSSNQVGTTRTSPTTRVSYTTPIYVTSTYVVDSPSGPITITSSQTVNQLPTPSTGYQGSIVSSGIQRGSAVRLVSSSSILVPLITFAIFILRSLV